MPRRRDHMLLRIKIVHKEKVHQNEFNLVPKFQNIQLQEDKMKQQKDKKERKQCGTVSVTSVTTVSWKQLCRYNSENSREWSRKCPIIASDTAQFRKEKKPFILSIAISERFRRVKLFNLPMWLTINIFYMNHVYAANKQNKN